MADDDGRKRDGFVISMLAGQSKARQQATSWYHVQSRRLGVTPEELSDAVSRGWPGDWITALPVIEVARLKGKPIAPETLAALVRMQTANILPLPVVPENPWAGCAREQREKRERREELPPPEKTRRRKERRDRAKSKYSPDEQGIMAVAFLRASSRKK